jgi:hypothetical protein
MYIIAEVDAATIVDASGYVLILVCRLCCSSVVVACVAVPPSDTILRVVERTGGSQSIVTP